MTKKLISDEELEGLHAKGCVGLCPICGMPVYVDQKHEEPIIATSYSLRKSAA